MSNEHNVKYEKKISTSNRMVRSTITSNKKKP